MRRIHKILCAIYCGLFLASEGLGGNDSLLFSKDDEKAIQSIITEYAKLIRNQEIRNSAHSLENLSAEEKAIAQNLQKATQLGEEKSSVIQTVFREVKNYSKISNDFERTLFQNAYTRFLLTLRYTEKIWDVTDRKKLQCSIESILRKSNQKFCNFLSEKQQEKMQNKKNILLSGRNNAIKSIFFSYGAQPVVISFPSEHRFFRYCFMDQTFWGAFKEHSSKEIEENGLIFLSRIWYEHAAQKLVGIHLHLCNGSQDKWSLAKDHIYEGKFLLVARTSYSEWPQAQELSEWLHTWVRSSKEVSLESLFEFALLYLLESPEARKQEEELKKKREQLTEELKELQESQNALQAIRVSLKEDGLSQENAFYNHKTSSASKSSVSSFDPIREYGCPINTTIKEVTLTQKIIDKFFTDNPNLKGHIVKKGSHTTLHTPGAPVKMFHRPH